MGLPSDAQLFFLEMNIKQHPHPHTPTPTLTHALTQRIVLNTVQARVVPNCCLWSVIFLDLGQWAWAKANGFTHTHTNAHKPHIQKFSHLYDASDNEHSADVDFALNHVVEGAVKRQ